MMLKVFSNFAFFLTKFYTFFFFLLSVSTVCGQDFEAKIKILPDSLVSVEGKFTESGLRLASREVSFVREYADVSDLGKRYENLEFIDEKGNRLEVNKLIDGEFELNGIPKSWKYEVKAKVSDKITDAAHISWVAENQGLLLLADLLPVFRSEKKVSAKIEFELPTDWKVSSNEKLLRSQTYYVENTEKAVFLVGKNFREKVLPAGKSPLNLVLSGDWLFTDEQAAEFTVSILKEYEKIFGSMPSDAAQIIILPFPQKDAGAERWRAETRGQTTVIMSGVITLKSVAVQRLHEQLRHETFHFWIPNALDLSGNYDWFYEGFALYQALRTGIELNQIRFDDYLKTLSRAYDISQELSETQTFSLIDASNKRWTGSNTFIYAKGLSVAFLCEIALLRESKGKRNLDEVFRRVYEKHRFGNARTDGNTAILNILKSYPELVPIAKKYVEGNLMFSANDYFESAGLEFETKAQKNSPSKLIVKTKLDGRQKDLLDELGYNQWRKLLRTKQ